MAVIDSLTPEKGKVGHTGVVHGTGFKGNNASVTFGTANKPADSVQITSDEVVKFKVPATDVADREPWDRTKCIVNVSVGAASKSFIFQFDPPGTPPVLTSLDPANIPSSPTISTTARGADFTNNLGRVPDAVYLVEAGLSGDIHAETISAQSFSVTFTTGDERKSIPPLDVPYTVLVGFNDGSSVTGQLTVS